MEWTRVVFRITGPQGDSPPQGTGFVCGREGSVALVVTCWHVVREIGPDNLRIGDRPCTLLSQPGDDQLDLAVLRVEGLDCGPPLALAARGAHGLAFETYGYQPLGRPLSGTLGAPTSRPHPSHRDIPAWDWYLDPASGELEKVRDGYSGAPIYDPASRTVTAVITHRQGMTLGLAVDIAALPRVYPQAADRLGLAGPPRGREALPLHEPHARLLEILHKDGAIPEDLPGQVLALRPRNLREYRLVCIARWSGPRYALDRRFVRLTLLLDQGEGGEGERWQAAPQPYDDPRELVRSRPNDPAFVLLGDPGCGKSTLLRRLEYDLAREALLDADASPPLTWFVPLNDYRGSDATDPGAWLAARWAREQPHLPPLETFWGESDAGSSQHSSGAPASGRPVLWLLLDALNELPRTEHYRALVRDWAHFLHALAERCPACRVLVTCRSLDYSAPLSTPDLPVPQAEFQRLSDPRVQEFLAAYLPDAWQPLWADLEGSPRLEMERTPFYLRLEVDQFRARGGPPRGRADLFSGFCWQALERELSKDNPRLEAQGLLSEDDRKRVARGRAWLRAPHALPEEGALFPALADLAFRMQQREGGGSQVRLAKHEAVDVLDRPEARAVLAAGEALGLLSEDLLAGEVYFVHQLFQEYFAARRLAREKDLTPLALPWRAADLHPSLEDVQRGLADSEPLPEQDPSGWEETAVLAAALARDPAAFTTQVAERDLPLAGRCAAQPDVDLPDDLADDLRSRLLQRSRHPAADLRARIRAARALGDLGDPRLERRKGPHGPYLLPPFVEIEGGTYRIGSEEGDDEERPVHPVTLKPFALAMLPVTNAEWRLFMASDGYEDPTWWDTPDAEAWREGRLDQSEEKQWWRDLHRDLNEDLDGTLKTFRDLTSVQLQQFKDFAALDMEDLEAGLDRWYPSKPVRQPEFWDDPRYSHRAQPVVGICWYEARAYCNWLAAQSGLAIRLPTEAQWEAAARGPAGRVYPWGNEFDSSRCNSFEAHLRATTPVGVLPGGDTPEGIADLAGNVWEWTASLYAPYPLKDPDIPSDPEASGRRVLRGGAFGGDRRFVRAAYRYHVRPTSRSGVTGVRLCRVASPMKR
jgi:formylglycine-generating enzyme required for sulfatase activity